MLLTPEHSCPLKKLLFVYFFTSLVLFCSIQLFYTWYNNVCIPASKITIFRHFVFLDFMHFNVHADTEHVATNLLISLLCISTYSDRFPILDGI
jgi:hypothetical protein